MNRPLERAFAHGDCEHPRPLFDALDAGFCAVEADVYVVDGEILVGHDREDLRPGRTLEKLYLDPLADLVRRNGGHVHPIPAPFTLLIDLKEEGDAIYSELNQRLPRYQAMLSGYERGSVIPGPVMLLLSGDRPIETLRKEETRLAFIDGRLPDLDDPSSLDPRLMPWVSDNFGERFTWDGNGPMPEEERTALAQLIQIAHGAGVRLRFWATPERVEVWETLYEAEVDLLNTDNLSALAAFFRSRA